VLQREQTPLHCAARYGHSNSVAILINAGATIDVIDKVSYIE